MEHENFAVDLDVNDRLEGFLILTCKSCGSKSNHPLKGLAPGVVMASRCGHVSLTLEGDDIRSAQRALDGIKKAWDDLGKAFKKL